MKKLLETTINLGYLNLEGASDDDVKAVVNDHIWLQDNLELLGDGQLDLATYLDMVEGVTSSAVMDDYIDMVVDNFEYAGYLI